VLNTQGVVQSSKLLLVFASTVILGSGSHGTHDHILLSDGSASIQTSLSKCGQPSLTRGSCKYYSGIAAVTCVLLGVTNMVLRRAFVSGVKTEHKRLKCRCYLKSPL
jgi:hypothetical protein